MKRKNKYVRRTLDEYELTVLMLGDYELECFFFLDASEPLLYVWDCQKMKYNEIGDFFRFRWDAEDIEEHLIPGLESLIEIKKGNEIFASELISAKAEVDFTYFSSNSDLTYVKEDYQEKIETKLFLEIAKLWCCFLIISQHTNRDIEIQTEKDLP